MAFTFIPLDLDLSKNVISVTQQRENTIIETEMDLSKHYRSMGTSTTKTIKINRYLKKNQVQELENFIDEVGATVFYSKFPDINYTAVDHSKYYAFSFTRDDILQQRWKNNVEGILQVELNLLWHFQVAGIDRV